MVLHQSQGVMKTINSNVIFKFQYGFTSIVLDQNQAEVHSHLNSNMVLHQFDGQDVKIVDLAQFKFQYGFTSIENN